MPFQVVTNFIGSVLRNPKQLNMSSFYAPDLLIYYCCCCCCVCVYVSESSVIECIQDCEYVKCVFTLLSASYAGTRGYGSSYLVLRDNEIHVLLSRTAKRIHLKVIIPQECAAEECGANFYTVGGDSAHAHAQYRRVNLLI